MKGILIKGMEMPDKCLDCPIDHKGMCYVEERHIPSPLNRPEWCPLEEVNEDEWSNN